jgi:hypothetical protein
LTFLVCLAEEQAKEIVVARASPANSEHLIMEASPFATTNYNLIANGPVWRRLGRPRTVRNPKLGHARRTQDAMDYRFPNTQGSAMAWHLMLV